MYRPYFVKCHCCFVNFVASLGFSLNTTSTLVVHQIATFYSCATVKYANAGLLSDTCERREIKEQTIELNDLDGGIAVVTPL